jgi:biotin operon repressor
VATLAERIVQRLGRTAAPQDDDELAAQFNVARQAVNQACRRLEAQGVLIRQPGPSGKVVNRLRMTPDISVPTAAAPPPASIPRALLTEDEVKAAVRDHLTAAGYAVTVRWGRERGIDIDARRAGGRWIIEAKGEVALQPQQVNYFLGALGELVQRMDDPKARYALALPENRQYRGLVDRLPRLARQRLPLDVFFVRRADNNTFEVGIE